MRFYITCFLVFSLVFQAVAQSNLSIDQQCNAVSSVILRQFVFPKNGKVVLVNSISKTKLTNFLKAEAEKKSLTFDHFTPRSCSDSIELLKRFITERDSCRKFVFLIDSSDSNFLFQLVGRPDLGLKIPNENLFCDWLIGEDQFIRINSVDCSEHENFQMRLLKSLKINEPLFVTTKNGTRLEFIARNWVLDKGEIYCTPIEDKTNGVIVVDACAYWGPPVKPIKLIIKNGRVVNIDSLSDENQQEKWIKSDLLSDKNSSFLSEIGIGTNQNAFWKSDLMESEQARGTCHFGFGMNINYGGKIDSKKHFDLVVQKPTICIQSRCFYVDGVFVERLKVGE